MRPELWPTRLRNAPAAVPAFTAAPSVVGIQITGRCQLRCRHCFNRSGPEVEAEIPLEVIERMLDEMLAWGVRHLRLSGGEPTYHRSFREVVDACAARGIRIAMNTHGVYSERLLAYLETAPIEIFLVSIDGTEEANDRIRGTGTYRRAIESCRRLRQAGQQVMIALHVGRENRAGVGPLIAVAAGLGADFKVSPIRPVGRAADEMPGALLAPEEYLEVVAEVTALRRRYPQIRIYTDFDVLEDLPHGDCQRDPGQASCKAGRTMINVNYDGEIYPCAFFASPDRGFSAGNVRDVSLSQAWRAAPAFEPFRVHRKSDTCQGCGHYQRRCAGGCPAIAHAATGYLDALDPTCFAHLVQIGGAR
jgi:radical SAM protein with 4Fe4S-binding SPASM domain